jgi:hypothetical protein
VNKVLEVLDKRRDYIRVEEGAFGEYIKKGGKGWWVTI